MINHKIILIILSLFLAMGPAVAQNGRVGQHDAIKLTAPPSGITTESEGKQIIQDILDVVGLKANFEVHAANIPNAAAVTYAGKRFILFNTKFFDALINKTGTKWAAVSILAHEVGHHLNRHNVTATTQRQLELDADEFSGFALRKMGATVEEAQIAIKTAGEIRATRTHPGQYDRLIAIEKGWRQADDQVTGKSTAKVFTSSNLNPNSTNTTVRNSSTTQSEASSNSNILGKVVFNADPYTDIYITSKLNLVKVSNSKAAIIGKIARLNSQEYPFLIYDENNTQLFVNNKGNIVTRSGRQVGMLKAFN